MKKSILSSLLATLIVAAAAHAQTVVTVSSNISTSTTWTANNVYDLTQQIYVLPGATLTIEAGTVIANANLGSLAVCRGAQIFVNGTRTNPVIMTSTADRATWTANNPATGTWRAACNEWGNLTIMGRGYCSENAVVGNTAVPASTNVGTMEGLTAAFPGDPNVLYGGGNDDDDSGSIAYLSVRYGGKVLGLNNELNGLSLGAVGRATEIHHVEIMNNVDDGIEIWGGTVNLKYFSIWNVGDDSLDVDQGWRGKAQFGLIVQGYSISAAQGSGAGDKAFEMDGAEDSDWQPITTSVIENCTVISQPQTRGTTAWRDNARVQFHRCIFMQNGSSQGVVRCDNVDGDGAHGYHYNGLPTFISLWSTPYTTTSSINAPANPAAFYTTQTSGNLCEMTDSVFYQNNVAGYSANNTSMLGTDPTFGNTSANAIGVFSPANNNVYEPASSPITSISRAANFIAGGLVFQNVISLDPRPANDALTSAGTAAADGFFTPAAFRGAFAPGVNWLCGWTASQAYGFTPSNYVTGVAAGQAADASAASMDISNARNGAFKAVGDVSDLAGPHYTDLAGGSSLNFTFRGQPNQAIVLLAGTVMNPGVFNLNLALPGAGTIDVGTAGFPLPNVQVVADGTQTDFFNSFFHLGPTGQTTFSLPGYFLPGMQFNLQAVIYNSTTLIRTSNAVQVNIF